MYHLPEYQKEAVNYKELPVYIRASTLMLFKRNGYRNVVYLCSTLDMTVCRYRIFNMCESLEESLKWHGTFFVSTEMDIVERYLEYIDLLVIVRYAYSDTLAGIMEIAKKRCIPLIYDVDDLVFDPRYQDLIKETLSIPKEDNKWKYVTEHQFETARRCDGYIATNAFLKQCLDQVFYGKCQVIYNFYNKEQEIVSECYVKNGIFDNSIFEIGYFSGSPTHENDFQLVENELLEWMYGHPDTILKIIGYKKLSKPYLELEQLGRIIRKPIMDYIRLQREIAECDLNLIPLQDNYFTNCKSELKYFEAAIAGTISIASPTFVYKQCITDGLNGFLVGEARENWYDKIKNYYSMSEIRKNEIRYTTAQMASHVYCYRLYTERIEDVLNEFTNV